MTIRIPDSELAVLKTLWQLGGRGTAKQIREKLKPARDHATVSTLLRRLESRKFLKREKSKAGREYIYIAIAKPEKTRKELVKNLLHRAFDGSGIEMVQALFQTKPPSAEEIGELEELLKELKSQKSNKNKKSRGK